MAEEWTKSRVACVDVYAALSSNDLLHQFDRKKNPFDGAGALTVDNLDYWPVTGDSDQIDQSAQIMAFEFFVCLSKNYVVSLETDMDYTGAVKAFTEIFRDDSKTLLDLANAADDFFLFVDE